MNLRRLFAILIAAAMLFTPLAMQSGSAMAMAPADHHAQIMDPDHCNDQSDKSGDSQSMGGSCCIAMCTGIAVAAVALDEPLAFARIADRPSPEPFQRGYLAKLPTPPPRLA